jgi:hypothetical protein
MTGVHICGTNVPPARLDDHLGGARARGAILNAAFWGRGTTLRVGFMGGSQALRERVRDIAMLWITQTGANLRFEFWTAPDVDPATADIRVSFVQNGRSWSNIGRFAGAVAAGEATMNLGWLTEALADDGAHAVVLHEFGHALGMIHEHLSPVGTINWDRERVTADLKAQGWNDADVESNMFQVFDPSTIFATDLDPHSIMMYHIPPEWTRDGFTTPWNTSLTLLDKRLIREAYGARPGAPALEG